MGEGAGSQEPIVGLHFAALRGRRRQAPLASPPHWYVRLALLLGRALPCGQGDWFSGAHCRLTLRCAQRAAVPVFPSLPTGTLGSLYCWVELCPGG